MLDWIEQVLDDNVHFIGDKCCIVVCGIVAQHGIPQSAEASRLAARNVLRRILTNAYSHGLEDAIEQARDRAVNHAKTELAMCELLGLSDDLFDRVKALGDGK